MAHLMPTLYFLTASAASTVTDTWKNRLTLVMQLVMSLKLITAVQLDSKLIFIKK